MVYEITGYKNPSEKVSAPGTAPILLNNFSLKLSSDLFSFFLFAWELGAILCLVTLEGAQNLRYEF